MGTERPRLTQAQIASLREQLAAASCVARSLPGTKALREQMADQIIAEATERPRGRRPRSMDA